MEEVYFKDRYQVHFVKDLLLWLNQELLPFEVYRTQSPFSQRMIQVVLAESLDHFPLRTPLQKITADDDVGRSRDRAATIKFHLCFQMREEEFTRGV
jgi:hypothetical protein